MIVSGSGAATPGSGRTPGCTATARCRRSRPGRRPAPGCGPRTDHRDRAGGVLGDGDAHRPKQQAGGRAPAVGAEHDNLGVGRQLDKQLAGIRGAERLVHGEVGCSLGHLRPGGGEDPLRLLAPGREHDAVVQGALAHPVALLRAHAVGQDERPVLQHRLLGGPDLMARSRAAIRPLDPRCRGGGPAGGVAFAPRPPPRRGGGRPPRGGGPGAGRFSRGRGTPAGPGG